MAQYRQDRQYLLYFYDLPQETTSVSLAKAVKEFAGYDIKQTVQFVPDLYQEKPFRIGAIKVEPEKLAELEEKLRYFKLDGKPVRALKYNPDFLP